MEQGASTVVVCPYFLSPGRHWQEDIPRLAAAAAEKHPDIAYAVTAPIGVHELVAQVRFPVVLFFGTILLLSPR